VRARRESRGRRANIQNVASMLVFDGADRARGVTAVGNCLLVLWQQGIEGYALSFLDVSWLLLAVLIDENQPLTLRREFDRPA